MSERTRDDGLVFYVNGKKVRLHATIEKSERNVTLTGQVLRSVTLKLVLML